MDFKMLNGTFGEWTYVDEEEPKWEGSACCTVLIAFVNFRGEFEISKSDYINNHGFTSKAKKVIAWMPMPDNPDYCPCCGRRNG